MTSRLTVDGYTFDNAPSDYRKIINLSNTPQQVFRRQSSDFYQSDSQDVEVQVSGELSLNESTDLDELQTLQQKAINGGEVSIEFDPFFSGKGVITDNPFRQEDQRGQYDFTFSVNKIDTDPTGYPPHSTPQTGNTFELGSFDFGFDPDSVQQQYDRQTASVETLQGLNRTVDNKGLIPRVTVSGRTDGSGAQALWDKARNNALSYLSAEFQNGWSLITRLQVGNDPDAPDFVTGLLQYSMDVLIVKDPGSGIGQVSSFIDHDVRDTGSYTADSDSGSSTADTVSFQVSSGDTDLSGNTVTWPATTVSVQLNALNYVYAADPDNDGNGEVRVNQSAFPSDAAPLYEVETGSSGIVTVTDVREQDTTGGNETATTIGFTVDAGSDSDAGVSWSKTVLELTASTTNYVYADGTTGDVTFNTSGFPAGDVALYEVQTDANSVDVVLDQRAGTTVGGDDTVDTLGYDIQGGTGAIDGNYVTWDSTTVQLQFGATNYVYVVDPDNDGNGQVEVNQSAVPSDALGLWEVVTDGDGITSETDLRDSLIDDGDGSTSDLTFNENFSVNDSAFSFARVLALGEETVADPVLSQDYLGIAALTESVPDPSDAAFSAKGLSALTESFTVADGGSALVGGETNTWETASDWDNAQSEAGVAHEATTNTDHNDATAVKMGPAIANPYLSSVLNVYTPYHEDSGSTAYDFSGNNQDGTYGGSVSLGATGLLGTTAVDVTNDRIDYGTGTPVNLDGQDFCFTVWWTVPINGDQLLLYKSNAGSPNETLHCGISNTDEPALAFYSDDLKPSYNITTNQWQLWGFQYDSSNNEQSIWIDGQQIASQTASADLQFTDDDPLRVASGDVNGAGTSPGTPAEGRLWDFRLHDRPLTSAEHQYLYDIVANPSTLTTGKKT